MRRNLSSFETYVTHRVNCVKISYKELSSNREKYVGYIIMCDMFYFLEGRRKNLIEKYHELTENSIKIILSKYDFTEMILFKPESKVDCSIIRKNTKSMRVVKFVMETLKMVEDKKYGLIGNDMLANLVYGEMDGFDYFQKRSFDVLLITQINPMLKNFGLVMKRWDKNQKIVTNIIEKK